MNRLTWVSGLFFITSLVIYALLDTEESDPKKALQWDTYEPDYIAENLFNRNFDKTGKLTSTVFGERMESYSALDMTIFTNPEVTVFNEESGDDPAWKVTASEGSLYQALDQLQLKGSVTIKATDPLSQVQTITTPYLVLEIDSNQMHTDEKVIALGPHIEMQGVGLQADLNKQDIEILQDVEAFYEQTPAN
ncbi:LPS export ABC transporter periplasmic protein LptC [Echinimonas agarilytica]|uniref:Lipopolysaccharide export system protein LptC n=1 Tax=Echinimonas agarilytica TaxID=1215918 RepID=A0AA41W4Q1_9GAMM|nr:LPS export ABC transporter periplasmic protein LptC [Echinimonas agarilytica]MCM2678614.1 LPS export ABC transporter periplasmic protein LptC [Echinimonas agarilytica]